MLTQIYNQVMFKILENLSIFIPNINTSYLFFSFVGYPTEFITDHDMQWEIIRGIHVWLGDTIQLQFVGAHLGQKNTREMITERIQLA